MESFTGNVPTSWTTTTPTLMAQETGPGYVHSGNYSVRLSNGANLSQDESLQDLQTLGAFSGGTYWTRTSDPYNVNVVLSQLS